MSYSCPELWHLFAGILRRDSDDEYYLVTPVEKCRVDVALHPLMITDMQWDESGESAQLLAVLNAGGIFPVGPEYLINNRIRVYSSRNECVDGSRCIEFI